MPGDDNGNVYRALRDIVPPEFDYRTLSAYPQLYGPEDSRSYTNTWFKETNVSQDDWTDLIAMLRVMGTNGATAFTTENVRAVIHDEVASQRHVVGSDGGGKSVGDHLRRPALGG